MGGEESVGVEESVGGEGSEDMFVWRGEDAKRGGCKEGRMSLSIMTSLH